MSGRTSIVWGGGIVLAAVVAVGGCGGSSNSSSGSGNPTPSPSPTPQPPTSTSAITISGNAVSPKNIVVARGSQVTFVNNDNRPHEMDSTPHPEHTDCPEINQVGFLSPGQSRQTGNLNTARVCGFHDHNQDTNTNLQGTITIQ